MKNILDKEKAGLRSAKDKCASELDSAKDEVVSTCVERQRGSISKPLWLLVQPAWLYSGTSYKGNFK